MRTWSDWLRSSATSAISGTEECGRSWQALENTHSAHQQGGWFVQSSALRVVACEGWYMPAE